MSSVTLTGTDCTGSASAQINPPIEGVRTLQIKSCVIPNTAWNVGTGFSFTVSDAGTPVFTTTLDPGQYSTVGLRDAVRAAQLTNGLPLDTTLDSWFMYPIALGINPYTQLAYVRVTNARYPGHSYSLSLSANLAALLKLPADTDMAEGTHIGSGIVELFDDISEYAIEVIGCNVASYSLMNNGTFAKGRGVIYHSCFTSNPNTMTVLPTDIAPLFVDSSRVESLTVRIVNAKGLVYDFRSANFSISLAFS
jgi:hypothetical protein